MSRTHIFLVLAVEYYFLTLAANALLDRHYAGVKAVCE